MTRVSDELLAEWPETTLKPGNYWTGLAHSAPYWTRAGPAVYSPELAGKQLNSVNIRCFRCFQGFPGFVKMCE